MSKRIVVGVTGASGAALALETLRQLRERGAETHLVVSRGARLTIQYELGGGGFDRLCEVASHVHGASELDAPIASGSFPADGMAVVPCSMRSLAAMAHGLGDNLVTRAADVALKERRRLVICPREAPLHEGHLNAMLALTRMGAIVAPPVPPFYAGCVTMEDAVREISARILNWLGIEPGTNMSRWDGGQASLAEP